MTHCPNCSSRLDVHETEGDNQYYCQNCGFEMVEKLERLRPPKLVETEAPMWRQKMKESHPSRKGRQRKMRGEM